MKPRTALVDVDKMEQALTLLGNMDLSGPITYVKIFQIISGVRSAIIEEPEKEPCPSATRQKSSSPKSETGQ